MQQEGGSGRPLPLLRGGGRGPAVGRGLSPPPGACQGLLPWLQVEQGPAELTWGREGGDSFPLGAREVGVGDQR